MDEHYKIRKKSVGTFHKSYDKIFVAAIQILAG